MSKQLLMDQMEELTKQLKGAPLKDFERQQMAEAFEAAQGSVFDRARTAVREVLHAAPDYIDKKSEALESVRELLNEIEDSAASYEA